MNNECKRPSICVCGYANKIENESIAIIKDNLDKFTEEEQKKLNKWLDMI